MSYEREFATIELLLAATSAETRGVDAFALCIIKLERQLRRLLTFSVFQFPCFTYASVPELKSALADERIYVEGFIKGFEELHPKSIGDLVGPDYPRLFTSLAIVTKHRNKIFHGQITGQELSRDALLTHVSDLQQWCKRLGDGARSYIGYDGFQDSFHKSANQGFVSGYKINLTSVGDYRQFLRTLRR